jgi:glycosidase
MIDVVYNHTSPDSTLWNHHPEFFYRKPDGRPGNRVGEWTDVIDLDYAAAGLWDYQIESLRYWASIVDGFRCDVAPLVPMEFWGQARDEVAKINPGCVWLAETVHRSFGALLRRGGACCARDTEVFSAFDMEYEYDVRETFESYLSGGTSLGHWLDLLDFQESVYPDNYDKLRFLENHDTARIASLARGSYDLGNLTALSFFLKGTTLVYAGQEVASKRQPSLFDRDAIEWDTGRDLSDLMRRLARIKHDVLGARDFISFRADDECDVAVVTRDDGTGKMGVFSLRGQDADVSVELSDGPYENLLDGREVLVRDGALHSDGQPVIVCA